MTDHSYFTAEPNFAAVPGPAKRIGILFGLPSKNKDDGSTTLSVRIPTLVVAECVQEPEVYAQIVAEILNENAHRLASDAPPPQEGRENRAVRSFVDACVEHAEGCRMTDWDLYNGFLRWRRAIDIDCALSLHRFLHHVQQTLVDGISMQNRRRKIEGAVCFADIRLNGVAEPDRGDQGSQTTGFAVGDLVQLASGGPAMTVVHQCCCAPACGWFDGSTYQEQEFPLACLQAAEDDLPF